MSCRPGLTFDLAPEPDGTPPGRAGSSPAPWRQSHARYQPRCLKTCELAGFCRDEARAAGAVSVLGTAARDDLGGLDTIGTALALARGHPRAVRRPDRHRQGAAPRQERQRSAGRRRGMTLLPPSPASRRPTPAAPCR